MTCPVRDSGQVYPRCTKRRLKCLPGHRSAGIVGHSPCYWNNLNISGAWESICYHVCFIGEKSLRSISLKDAHREVTCRHASSRRSNGMHKAILCRVYHSHNRELGLQSLGGLMLQRRTRLGEQRFLQPLSDRMRPHLPTCLYTQGLAYRPCTPQHTPSHIEKCSVLERM